MDDFVMVGIGLANGEELLKSLRSKNIVKIMSYIFQKQWGWWCHFTPALPPVALMSSAFNKIQNRGGRSPIFSGSQKVMKVKNKYRFQHFTSIPKHRTNWIFEIAPLYMSYFTMSWIIPKSTILTPLWTPALKEPTRRSRDLPQLLRLLQRYT